MKARFHRVLVANRGEIACRVMQAVQEAGLESVAVYSDVDREALHVHRADRAVAIGGRAAAESYLDIEKLIAAAYRAGAHAVHPGYGFLSENADFAAAVGAAGLTFIGPRAEVIRAMGSKAGARAIAARAGVPVVPGYDGNEQADQRFAEAAEQIGFPVLVKASAGGGGRGMRIVRRREDLAEAVAGARREAEKSFADGRLLLERYVERPRHVEVQILGDEHGHVVHLGERECSIQRRHQKIVEETPAPTLTATTRDAICAAAVAAAKAIGYTNAGTVEFVVSAAGEFFFLEMNTRLQVEHPVTEATFGVDLVRQQLAIAAGAALPFAQSDLRPRGAAIEVRLYAEDPASGFLPSPGPLLHYREPRGTGFRIDSGVYSGWTVPSEYDPLLAKLSAWGEDREQARQRLLWALGHTVVLGIPTNRAFLAAVLAHPRFVAGDTHTHFVDDHFAELMAPREPSFEALVAATGSSAPPSAVGAPTRSAFDPWTRIGAWL